MIVKGYICPRCNRPIPIDERYIRPVPEVSDANTIQDGKQRPALRTGHDRSYCPWCYDMHPTPLNFIDVELPDDAIPPEE